MLGGLENPTLIQEFSGNSYVLGQGLQVGPDPLTLRNGAGSRNWWVLRAQVPSRPRFGVIFGHFDPLLAIGAKPSAWARVRPCRGAKPSVGAPVALPRAKALDA